MKALLTLSAALSLSISVMAIEPPVKSTSEGQTIRISLVETYTDCEEASAIYLVQEDGASSKVVDLDQMDRNEPYKAYQNNHKKFLYFMQTIGSEDYITKSIQVQDMNACGTYTRYELEPRILEDFDEPKRSIASF